MPRSHITFRLLRVAMILGCSLLLLGTSAAQPSAAAYLEEDDRFTTFTAILERAGRMSLLRHRDLITVFAPTEEAFRVLPEATVTTLLEDEALARAFVDLHLIDHDLIHEATGELVANGAVNPIDRIVALPPALRD